MFQWQKVETPSFGMLWTKMRRTRGQNKNTTNTQTTKTLTLQRKHRRISRKSLRGNPSFALKGFKSQKPTSQVNMCIIKFRLTNTIWQPIGSKILSESAFPFYTLFHLMCISCHTFYFPLFYPETNGLLSINLRHLNCKQNLISLHNNFNSFKEK